MASEFITGSIKRLVSGVFTNAKASEIAKPTLDLCEGCGIKMECGARRAIMRVQRKYPDTPVALHFCGSFEYPLEFSKPVAVNLDRESVNTIRLGSALAKRLQPGDKVRLFSPEWDGGLPRKVDRIYSGPKQDILLSHAVRNHVVVTEGLSRKKAAERMEKLLIGLYGTNWYANAETLTAIYLRHFDEEGE